jgi:hypothetical protein
MTGDEGAGADGDTQGDRLLLAMADHLHDHCECSAAEGGEPCAACDLRGQLRDVRERLLAWRAAGRRLATQRIDATDNVRERAARAAGRCETCASLDALARTLGAARR